MLRAPQPAKGRTLPLRGLFGHSAPRPAAHAALRDCCLALDKISERFVPLRGRSRVSCLAQHDVCRSIRENESGAKTKTSGAKANAFLCDDDANSPTRYSGERGDKHRPRRAISCQSQDDRQMEGA